MPYKAIRFVVATSYTDWLDRRPHIEPNGVTRGCIACVTGVSGRESKTTRV